MAASRSDVQPVLDAVAERAAQLCNAPYARIFLVDGDALRIAADYSLAREVPIPVHARPAAADNAFRPRGHRR